MKMEQREFWELHDSGKLESVSIWRKESYDGHKDEIVAFRYNGRFYLRIVKHYEGHYGHYTGRRGSRRWVEGPENRFSSFIKEFQTPAQANAYFKKCAAGFTKEA